MTSSHYLGNKIATIYTCITFAYIISILRLDDQLMRPVESVTSFVAMGQLILARVLLVEVSRVTFEGIEFVSECHSGLRITYVLGVFEPG